MEQTSIDLHLPTRIGPSEMSHDRSQVRHTLPAQKSLDALGAEVFNKMTETIKSGYASPLSMTSKVLKKGAMDGPLGGKHLAEYMPSAKPPRPKRNSRSPKMASKSRSPDQSDQVFQGISMKEFEKIEKKRTSGHMPWQSSKQMHYLRLSKGRRKPTGQEIASTLAETQVFNTFLNSLPTPNVIVSKTTQSSGKRTSEHVRMKVGNSASSVKTIPVRSKIFQTNGPEEYAEEV